MRKKVFSILEGKSFQEEQGISTAFKDSLLSFLNAEADKAEKTWKWFGLLGDEMETSDIMRPIKENLDPVKLKIAGRISGITARQLQVFL